MHAHLLSDWQHEHNFASSYQKGERRTKIVLVLTFFTMLLEIGAGSLYGSMALLADGWHMGTHVAAFLIAIIAYRYSRIHAHDDTFAFSTAKVSLLGGFASSIALGVVALIMVFEAIQRIFVPHLIQFDEAIAVAAFGLSINLICALILQHHDHPHVHPDEAKPDKRQHRKLKRNKAVSAAHDHLHHDHEHHHHDHNLKAAYMHVLADAFTSVLAIAALLAGKYYQWNWLDPLMAIVGGLVIGRWSYTLIKESAPILLDESIAPAYKQAIIMALEQDPANRVADLHIWRVGVQHFAMIVVIVSPVPRSPYYYKKLLTEFHSLKHITIEVNQCPGVDCPA